MLTPTQNVFSFGTFSSPHPQRILCFSFSVLNSSRMLGPTSEYEERDPSSESEEHMFWESREEKPLLRGGGWRGGGDVQPAEPVLGEGRLPGQSAGQNAAGTKATSESCCCFKPSSGPRSTTLLLIFCLNTGFALLQLFFAYWAHSMSLVLPFKLFFP